MGSKRNGKNRDEEPELNTHTIFFPKGGPNTPLRLLSSLDRMMFWVCAAVVWAEKLMRSGLYTSFSSLFNRKSCREGVLDNVVTYFTR